MIERFIPSKVNPTRFYSIGQEWNGVVVVQLILIVGSSRLPNVNTLHSFKMRDLIN
tara:strand:+ start:95 stop:262 length:168 start_codon:yes stop_codon:yes gene_type:complete